MLKLHILHTSTLSESLLGEVVEPVAKAAAWSWSSTMVLRFMPGSLLGLRPAQTTSVLRLLTRRSGYECLCLGCSGSWMEKRDDLGSEGPVAQASGIGGSGGG